MKIPINLNEEIKVKLTDLGKLIYFHRFDQLNRSYGRIVCKPTYPIVDEDGYTSFQLWAFMELYGPHMGMTSPPVIENNTVIYDVREDEQTKFLEDILPSAQTEYEELTPEEAASEIASGSIMSARYWLDAMILLKQMGYVICRKR